MITSDLYAFADVERIAERVGAATRSEERGIEIEAAYPGATLWAHRHPVLLGLLIGALTWLACASYIMLVL